MKRYKLKKDLPTFKAGDEFFINGCGDLLLDVTHTNDTQTEYGITAYCASTLHKFPNILKDWFEEIPEQPKTVWDLEFDDRFYLLGEDGDIKLYEWYNGYSDERALGNVFLTKEEAEKELARRKAKVILVRDTKGFKPKFQLRSGISYPGWLVEYDVDAGELFTMCYIHSDGTPRFATQEDAEESIRKHEKEWKIYLGVEDAE